MQAIEYLLSLKSKDYRKQIVAYVETLVASLKEEEKIMYVSMFEEVYTERGMEKERVEVARKMLNKGFSIDDVQECTTLPREEVERLRN